MRNRKVVVALMLVGTAGWAGFTRADDSKATADKVESTEIQHLRAARKDLNDAKDAFEKDAVDKDDHRKEILEGIDKAITAIDTEIEEYKALQK
jgi:soluble cytochrome b562